MPAAPPKLLSVLQQQRAPLLDGWVREQLSSDALRADLLGEGELRTESTHFLDLFTTALANGPVGQIRAPHFGPVLQFLAGLSASRGRQGFSPTEVATFVFSLKQPLFDALRTAYGADAVGLLDESWTTTQMLDKLGLYTTETYQQTREEIIRRQQEEMMELSTPVVRLWEGVLALPLIGTLDSARTSVVMETLLQTMVETGSEIAIIDITGVPTVDTLVAQHLLKTVAAARLMGVECIISGIRPQIAQTMVHLQIDLSAVITRATMAEALQVGFKRLGLRVSESQGSAVAGMDLPF